MSEVVGKIKLIGEVKTFGDSFNKREIVVTTDDQYPQMIMVELHQDKCDLINGYKVGDDIKVSINIRGKEWISPQGEAKYFNSLVGWRIEKVSQDNAQPQEVAPQGNSFITQDSGDETLDLPF